MASYEAAVSVGPSWTKISNGVTAGGRVTIKALGGVELHTGGATAPASNAVGLVLEEGGLIFGATIDQITPSEVGPTEVWARTYGPQSSVEVRIWHE